MSDKERKSVQDTFTGTGAGTALRVDKNERFSISVSGFGTATVQFQRRLDGANWRVIESYTANTEKDGIAPENMEIRLEVSSYTSGTIIGRLGR